MYVHAQLLRCVGPRELQPGSSFPGIFQNTGVGGHFLIQGILPTQGSNPHLLHFLRCQVDSLPTSEGMASTLLLLLLSLFSRVRLCATP